MASSTRQKRRLAGMPNQRTADTSRSESTNTTTAQAAVPAQPPSSGMAAGAVSLSPTAERAAFMRRRAIAMAILVGLVVLAAFFAARFFAPQSAGAPNQAPPAVVGNPQPAELAPGNQAPPAVVSNPQPAELAASTCSAIVGMPVFAGATCIKQTSDTDDGVTKLENTYIAGAAADEVRRFYEQAFAQNGWRIDETDYDAEDQKWKYDVEQGLRKLKIEIAAQPGTQTNMTEVRIAED